MSVKSVQFAVATHIMAALGIYPGGEVGSATLADSVQTIQGGRGSSHELTS